MDVIYLTVPYKDKEIVKALGARWDAKDKRWYVDRGSQVRFARWFKPEEAQTNMAGSFTGEAVDVLPSLAIKPVAVEIKNSDRVGASLSSVLFQASEAVRRALPTSRWIMAEVASIRTHAHSSHTYLELVEHDEAGREIAKANARVWAGNARILKKFERETGGPVAEGMKILLLAQADFSIQYGFGLTIDDIDSAWTLGEMQRKISQIRERLVAEGLFDLNAGLKPAADFVSVAVIAPDGAAGLGDFMADANFLVGAELCEFFFIPAVFEGPAALVSVVSALAVAQEMAQRKKVDAVVVVRGGGAKTSLNWLNEYEMAALICSMGVPVMMGVGHERDSTILDEVSCESFDTPSKVVGAIVARIVSNAQHAKLALTQIKAGVAQACSSSESETVALRSEVETLVRQVLSEKNSRLNAELVEIRSSARGEMRDARSSIDSLAREVIGLGPAASLERGYGVASQDGVTKGRVAALDFSKAVVLRLADGEVVLHMNNGAKELGHER